MRSLIDFVSCVGCHRYKSMSKLAALARIGRVISHWTLLSLFISGTVMVNLFLWAPQAMTGSLGKFGREMGQLAARTPPWSWMGFTFEQLMIFGAMFDIIGIIGLMNFHKLSAILVFIMTGSQEVFYRMNAGNLSNHPLCGYTAPYCVAVDVVRWFLFTAAVFVFTAPLPLPETTVNFMKQLGMRTRWVDKTLKKIRQYMPLEGSVTVPVAREAVPREVVGKTKET